MCGAGVTDAGEMLTFHQQLYGVFLFATPTVRPTQDERPPIIGRFFEIGATPYHKETRNDNSMQTNETTAAVAVADEKLNNNHSNGCGDVVAGVVVVEEKEERPMIIPNTVRTRPSRRSAVLADRPPAFVLSMVKNIEEKQRETTATTETAMNNVTMNQQFRNAKHKIQRSPTIRYANKKSTLIMVNPKPVENHTVAAETPPDTTHCEEQPVQCDSPKHGSHGEDNRPPSSFSAKFKERLSVFQLVSPFASKTKSSKLDSPRNSPQQQQQQQQQQQSPSPTTTSSPTTTATTTVVTEETKETKETKDNSKEQNEQKKPAIEPAKGKDPHKYYLHYDDLPASVELDPDSIEYIENTSSNDSNIRSPLDIKCATVPRLIEEVCTLCFNTLTHFLLSSTSALGHHFRLTPSSFLFCFSPSVDASHWLRKQVHARFPANISDIYQSSGAI